MSDTAALPTWEYYNGLRNPAQSKAPSNLEELRKLHRAAMLAMPPQDVQDAWAIYKCHLDAADDKVTRLYQITAGLVGRISDPFYHQVFCRRFSRLPSHLGFNNFLEPPKPSIVEGPNLSEFGPFPIHRLHSAVLYKNSSSSLALAHLAGETTQPGGMARAIEKCAYVGAALVYARNQALDYLGIMDVPGSAHVITFATDGNTIDFFAHFSTPVAPSRNEMEYHQYRLNSIKIPRNSIEGFWEARTVMLNAQVFTRLQSLELSDRLKENWRQYGDQFLEKPAVQKASKDEDLKHAFD